MKTIHEYIVNKRIESSSNNGDLELYEATDGFRYVLINGLKEFNDFISKAKYMLYIPLPLIKTYKSYVKSNTYILFSPYISSRNEKISIAWEMYNDSTRDSYKKVREINYEDFTIEYWEDNNWPVRSKY